MEQFGTVSNVVKPGYTQVILKDDLAEKVKQRLQIEKKPRRRVELSTYVQELLWEIIDEDEMLRRYGPLLEELSVEDNRILIKDNKTDQIAELTFRDNVLFCSIDNSDNCIHVGFAFAIPKVYKVMNARGQRRPDRQ